MLARESVAFFREAQEILAAPVELGFRACGYMFLAHSEVTLEQLRANVAVQNSAGVPSRLVSPGEAADLVRGLLTDTVVGATWCAEDGYFDRPQSVVEAFAQATEIAIGEVVALRRDGQGWALLLRDGSTMRAGQAVVAVGCDTVSLLRPLGAELPIEPENRWFFLSKRINERLLEPLVVSPERRFAAKQLGDGEGARQRPVSGRRHRAGAPRWREAIRRSISELLPVLEYADFNVLAHGLYDVTPDRQAIIGRVPGCDGLWVAAGFSGHGFMLAPAVGRILADAIAGESESEALSVLDAARFASGRLVSEPQIV